MSLLLLLSAGEGGPPPIVWTQYTTPFPIESGTLWVYSVDAVGNAETPHSYVYTIQSGILFSSSGVVQTLKSAAGATVNLRRA